MAQRGRLSPPGAADRLARRHPSGYRTPRTAGASGTRAPRPGADTWRLAPVVNALQALRGGQGTVAVTTGAERGDLTRCEPPRQLRHSLGVTPAEDSTGERRRQGGITKTGNSHARRALVAGAWASRYPAKVSRHLQRRLEKVPTPLQDMSGKAQVRLCKRYRPLLARGQNANQVVGAIARELRACMWAMAQEVPLTP
jgi:transposase